MKSVTIRLFVLFVIACFAAVPSGRSAAGQRLAVTVDDYAYDAAQRCDPIPKPGVEMFRDVVLSRSPEFTNMGIYSCRSVRGGTALSLHAEGRAWDMGASAADPAELAAANDLVDALLAPDSTGAPHALARKIGLQEIIWNRRIWTSGSRERGGADIASMAPYTGTNSHTDHIHFGFNRSGAWALTSWWSTMDMSGFGGQRLRLVPLRS